MITNSILYVIHRFMKPSISVVIPAFNEQESLPRVLNDLPKDRLHQIIADEQPYTFLFVSKWTAILDKRIVIREGGDTPEIVYKKITPTQTGDYSFHFNKWIKLAEMPELTP